jgi:DNA topoisomerase-1
LAGVDKDVSRLEAPDGFSISIKHPCRHCGKEMVKRKGLHGHFLGCTGYPNCNNTEPVIEKEGSRKSAKK